MVEQAIGHDRAVVLRDSQILIGGEAIRRRVAELASHIDRVYRDRRVVVLGTLKGAIHFLSDLTRCMTVDQNLGFVRVSTYLGTTQAVCEPRPEFYGELDLAGQDVLVVDDILDRGRTLQALKALVEAQRPRSLRFATLLVKDGAIDRIGIRPDFVGFEIPDTFVVGYGLDFEERYRNLPDIYIFEQSPPE